MAKWKKIGTHITPEEELRIKNALNGASSGKFLRWFLTHKNLEAFIRIIPAIPHNGELWGMTT